mmetsp:Transcript_33915/g.74408  ORF Transcript_33915/g.74408 Transcript_33915/m.74408 type:complete len:329 (+) Transcript_33915:123-1109(+)
MRHPLFAAIRHVSAYVLLLSSITTRTRTQALSTGNVSSPSKSTNNNKGNNGKVERPRIPVLQYKDNWVCVNKPAGLTVHRSRGTSPRQFVLSTLLKRQLSRKVFPVHRLDHRTSGAILFSFDSETAGKLHGSLRSTKATKQYVALLRGDLDVELGATVTIDKPLKVGDIERTARTDFTLLASAAGSDDQRGDIESRPDFVPACSLVLCEPKTGRTHQIRRHAYALGHPVLGDTEHGDSKVNRWWRNNRGLNRLGLHCFSLHLPPVDGIDDDSCVQCVAPLSPELLDVLKGDGMENLWKEALKREPGLSAEFVDLRGGSFGRNYIEEKQ